MVRASGIGLGVVLVAGVVAGCGSSSQSTTAAAGPSSGYEEEALAVGREFSRCARANGAPNFPDPAIDENGVLAFPDASKADIGTVGNACQDIARRVPAPPPQEGEPPSDEMFALQQRYARCARENGAPDWPDPRRDGADPFAGTEIGRVNQAANLGARVPQRLIDVRNACERIEFEMNAQMAREEGNNP